MSIRGEADRLLERTGLMDVLRPFGAVAIVGSYSMDLMAWNDLDVYVDAGDWTVERYCDVLGAVAKAVQPVRVDGFQDAAQGRYFIGMETMITGQRWNIDIWGRSTAEIADAQRSNAEMKRRFDADPELRSALVRIKQGLIARGMYGFDKGAKHYHSPEIYRAVLDEGVRTTEEFLRGR